MAQNMSYREFEEYYLSQVQIDKKVRAKTDLEALKILLNIKSFTEEKDFKEWKKIMNNFKNKKIN